MKPFPDGRSMVATQTGQLHQSMGSSEIGALMPLIAAIAGLCHQQPQHHAAGLKRTASPYDIDLLLLKPRGETIGGKDAVLRSPLRLEEPPAPPPSEEPPAPAPSDQLAIEGGGAAPTAPDVTETEGAAEVDEITELIKSERGKAKAAAAAAARVKKRPSAAPATLATKQTAADAKQPKKQCTYAASMKAAGYVEATSDKVTLPKGWSVYSMPPRTDKYFLDPAGNRFRSVIEVKAALGV